MGVNPLALLEGTMTIEGVEVQVPSVWGYNEYNKTVEELNQRLINTTWELQNFRFNAREEIKKKEEQIQRLIQLLNVTSQQRDEARNHLHLLLKQLMPPSSVEPSKGNSSVTECDRVSDSRNRQSYVSSPIESFFDADISSMADSCQIRVSKYDQDCAMLEQLVSKRTLPEKGKLMDAVVNAGPLLQSLLVAGPLPRWKNPPPMQQLRISPLSVKGQNPQRTMASPCVEGYREDVTTS